MDPKKHLGERTHGEIAEPTVGQRGRAAHGPEAAQGARPRRGLPRPHRGARGPGPCLGGARSRRRPQACRHLGQEKSPGRPAARHSARGEGHHLHQDPAHDLRLADLSRPCRGQGRRLRHAARQGGRHRAGQGGDHGIRRRPCRQDAQSAQSPPHAGRLVVGLGGGRRRLHGAGGLRHPDRGLGDPARRLQRRRGLQGQPRLGRHDGHQGLCPHPRHAGLLRPRGQ